LAETVEVLCEKTDRHGRSNLRLQIILPAVYIKKRQGSRVWVQDAMMDGEEGTAKHAKGAKRQAKLLFKDESYKQST
ncbi:MAG: hypothetical protein Q7U75_07275, partial [Desulfobacterales bacterium]|nr:hypothetical protein [Desulfobacterales bacterium]